jgi:hypothetical protein
VSSDWLRLAARPTSARIWSLHCSSSVLELGRQRSAFAQQVEQALDVVGEGHHRSRPKMPAEPLTVWAQRNSASSSSRLSGVAFQLQQQLLDGRDLLAASLMKAGSSVGDTAGRR